MPVDNDYLIHFSTCTSLGKDLSHDARNPPQWKFRNPWDEPRPSGAGEFNYDFDAVQIDRIV